MKLNRTVLFTLVTLIVVAALYRVIPGRPFGFAPQIAMALFAGSVIKDKKWAFALPILSMFISDLIYEILYTNGLSSIQGFYEGQITNYILFALLTIVGFYINQRKVVSIVAGALAGPTIFFIISNFLVWFSGGGYQRPKTLEGLMTCYNDALPFYRNSLMGTLFFAALFFGGYYLLQKYVWKSSTQIA